MNIFLLTFKIIIFLFIWGNVVNALPMASHYKQLADDNHTYLLYSFRCKEPAEKKNCSLQALAVSDEKAKNSCYVVYKTIFKNKSLKLQKDGSYIIRLFREKCDDFATYIFYPKFIISSFQDNTEKHHVSVSDERCEIFKANKNEAFFLSQQPIIPQIGFGDCKNFTFRMDE